MRAGWPSSDLFIPVLYEAGILYAPPLDLIKDGAADLSRSPSHWEANLSGA